ncbi:MAG: hypothetical protein DLM71_04845 [Chloroflexi bacterium]|nr:MAG: hypothetical protein DLM71_04845 [Chloroflexota bacterium]
MPGVSKANAGKDLEVIVYPEDEYQTKISTALVAGSPPDLAMIENRNWMKVGYVVDLSDKLDEWGVGLDDYSPGGLAPGAPESDPADGLYGIGTFLGGFPIVYNKAMFDAAGLDYPSVDDSMTFAEYADLCRQLAQPNQDPTQTVYGCTMTPDPYNYYPIYGPDGHLPLTVPAFTGNPFFIFLLRQYMRTIPKELDEAARIDGAGFWTIWRIVLPLSVPALVVIGVFTFLGVWNDFFGPLLYLDDQNWFTVPLALAREVTRVGTEWNIVMAATLVAMLPPLIVYAFSQNKLMGGIASVGIRG